MDNRQGSRIVGGNSNYGRKKSDFYPTPPEATIALIRFLEDKGVISKGFYFWDPACGENDMVNAVVSQGHFCIGTDILYGDEQDYFQISMPKGVDFIVTNPPFSFATEFINRSLEFEKPFALLLKSHFYHAKSRYKHFMNNPPDYVLPLTWRPNFFFKDKNYSSSPLMDMSWYVWMSSGNNKITQYYLLQKS